LLEFSSGDTLLHRFCGCYALRSDLGIHLLGGSNYVDHEENVLAVFHCAKESAIGREAKVAVLGREGSFRTYAVIAMKNLQWDGHSLGLAPNR